MTREWCSSCYGGKTYCRKCKTYHCDCSWNRCQRASKSPVPGDGLQLILPWEAELRRRFFYFDDENFLRPIDSTETFQVLKRFIGALLMEEPKKLGARGGKVKSEAKAASSRENGKKGGRPPKEPAQKA